ncbi:MAG: SCP2 sterol-binding domain-containing protein [Deltaproteobacteria bacterium]|nr:SCP2 sterol-binding domain-containing protein [Deltaproteobacteria bacterium]
MITRKLLKYLNKDTAADREAESQAIEDSRNTPSELSTEDTADFSGAEMEREEEAGMASQVDKPGDALSEEETGDEGLVSGGQAVEEGARKSQVETPVEAAGDDADDDEDEDDDEAIIRDEELLPEASYDPLGGAYDLRDGRLIEQTARESRDKPLPWSSKVKSAKDFFHTELLYRFDLLELEEREGLRGSYRVEIRNHNNESWTVKIGDDIEVVKGWENANSSLSMNERDFLHLVNGRINPQIAILARKIRVSGDFKKAVTFQSFLYPYKE